MALTAKGDFTIVNALGLHARAAAQLVKLANRFQSDIFIVKDGVLIAPPKTHLMLPGITYDVIIELAEQHKQPLVVREISEAELRAADEVWMTSSTKEILAIATLDGKPVGTGKPGPYAEQMWQWYQDFKNTVMRKG